MRVDSLFGIRFLSDACERRIVTDSADDVGVFDADVIARAAETHDVDETTLGSVVERHQASVESLPGVENLAYEWRKQYESPLLERTPAAYYFAVPERVWREFGDALEIDGPLLDALRHVHRQTVTVETDVDSDPAASVTYVVLDRNAGGSELSDA